MSTDGRPTVHQARSQHPERIAGIAGVLVLLLFLAACDTWVSERGYTISGSILTSSGPVSGILVQLDNGRQATTYTDNHGRYVFSGLSAGHAYTVLPYSPQYHFEPAAVTIDPLESDFTFDFEAIPAGDVVGGVNLARLFEPASPGEIAAVASDWEMRSVQSAGYVVELEEPSHVGITRIVSHLVDGHRHYAMVHLPPASIEGTFPLIVLNHGGDVGFDTVEYLDFLYEVSDFAESAIIVAPVFRSETLVHEQTEFLAEGQPSTWDRDVDDALGAMQVVLDNEPRADAGRIATLGFSRGGGVSLLMSIREPRIKAAVTFFGPTDFFDEYVQHVTRTILGTGVQILPGTRYLMDTVLGPLRDKTLSYEDARLELVRRSPVLYADRLPALQVHHGTGDIVVWVSQAYRLDEALRATGRTSPSNDYEFYIYEGAGHSPEALTGSLTRTADFLFRHLSE